VWDQFPSPPPPSPGAGWCASAASPDPRALEVYYPPPCSTGCNRCLAMSSRQSSTLSSGHQSLPPPGMQICWRWLNRRALTSTARMNTHDCTGCYTPIVDLTTHTPIAGPANICILQSSSKEYSPSPNFRGHTRAEIGEGENGAALFVSATLRTPCLYGAPKHLALYFLLSFPFILFFFTL